MPMREVKLYGELGRRFGRLHRFDVATPAEAIRALCANFKGFEQALDAYRPGFHVLVGQRDAAASDDALQDPFDRTAPIKIIPAFAGAKSGWMSIILGAALIAAAFFMPAAIGGLSLFGTTTVASLAGTIGFGLALGGVAQLLSPTPSSPTNAENGESRNSYVFNGAVNVTTQGGPVPVGYGRMIVGSVVASMGITVRELPT